MAESKFVALVRNPKNSCFFRVVLSDEPCDTIKLSQDLEREGFTLIDVGMSQQLDKVQMNLTLVESIQKS